MNGVGSDVLLAEMIVHTTRSGHHHVRIDLLERAVLFHCRATAVTAYDAEGGLHGFEHLLDLQGQLARRHQNDGLHPALGFLEALHQRNEAGQRLAGAGGRKQHQILALAVGGTGFFLHGIERVNAQVP